MRRERSLNRQARTAEAKIFSFRLRIAIVQLHMKNEDFVALVAEANKLVAARAKELDEAKAHLSACTKDHAAAQSCLRSLKRARVGLSRFMNARGDRNETRVRHIHRHTPGPAEKQRLEYAAHRRRLRESILSKISCAEGAENNVRSCIFMRELR